MKKISKRQFILITGIIMSVFLLVACGNKKSLKPDLKPDMDSFYDDLKNAINDPEAGVSNDISGKIKFSAIIVSDAYDITIDEDEKTYRYQNAAIARNLDHILLLNVSNIDEIDPGTVVSIEGEIDGFIYYFEDNKRVKKLNIVAKNVAPLEPIDKSTPSQFIEVNQPPRKGIIELEKAFSVDNKDNDPNANKMLNKDAIKLYLSYENTGKVDSSPLFSDLGHIYVGNSELQKNSIPTGLASKIEIEDHRLNMDYGITEPTYPGKKVSYYVTLSPISDDDILDLSEPLIFEDYDDDFNLVKYFEMDITLLDKNNLVAK